MAQAILEAHSISKKYGETTVLSGCNFSLYTGEIHALLGGNGAGKSTFVRILSGLLAPTSGQMRLAGSLYQPRNKRDAEIAGVEIVQQEFNLIPTLSVAENIFLSRLPHRLGRIRWGELHSNARTALDRLNLTELSTETLVRDLGVGNQQLVEIATALDRKCKVLILDEPTAALSAKESETLFDWLNRLRQNSVGIIYISHRLEEVKRIADRVTFLRDGSICGTHDSGSLDVAQMLSIMAGTSQATQFSKDELSDGVSESRFHSRTRIPSTPLLQVENLSGGPVKGASLAVRSGERVGVFGLIGSGRTELLRLIFGADIASSGKVIVMGQALTSKKDVVGRANSPLFRHPSEAVAAGVAMITEDRKVNGLLLTQSIRVNSTLSSLWPKFSSKGFLLHRREAEASESLRIELGVRSRGIEQPAGTLSGGNQQKIVIAKWLATDASVYLFDEPTRGIDMTARRRIYELLDALAEKGKGMLIVSSDIDELFETCDRILVMSNGELVDEIERTEFSKDRVMKSSFAGYMGRSVSE